jgi:porin
MMAQHPVWIQLARAAGMGVLCFVTPALGQGAAPPSATDASAREAEAEPERAWFGVAGAGPYTEWDQATGDWAGRRNRLEDQGLTLDGEYVAEYTAVLDGGVRDEGSFRNVLTASAELDTHKAFGLDGGTALVQYLHANAERGGSFDAGDIQIYSNLETAASLDVIFEAWYQQTLFDDRLRIKVGKVDANTEFNHVDVAGEFANSSAGFSPTIFTFPSYPDSATSVNLFVKAIQSDALELTLSYGLYDGALAVDGVATGRRGPSTFFDEEHSDDYFHVSEAEIAWPSLGVLGDGRVSVGGWWHSGAFTTFDEATRDGTGGVYATIEQRVVSFDGANDDRGLYAFAQYGWADDEVSDFEQHFGVGVVAMGPLAGRVDDSAGVYYSLADLSDEPGAGFAENESVVDAYYRAQVTPAFYLQPEVQYIANPSGDPATDNALVGGVRVGVTF